MRESVPRYLTIEQALRADIAGLQPGDALPTEAALCDRFGVSRMTAREGVRRLVDEGLLVRIRGRGTFVAQPSIHRQTGHLLSFSQEMRARSLRPTSRILEVAQVVAPDDAARALGLDQGSRVMLLRRLRLADELPMAVERTLLVPACAAVLGADLETGSLHEALEALGHAPSFARGTIRPSLAGPGDESLLDAPPGTPMLVETRVVYDAEELPLEHTETRYSPTRYVFDTELRRPD